MSFSEKKAVITGGSSGIGLSIAYRLLAQGAEVVIIGRSPDKLQSARTELEGKGYQGKVETAAFDVTYEEAVHKFFDQAGDFDYLVTAAGPEPRDQPVLELPIEKARAMFESKYWGQYYAVRYGAPHMRKGGSLLLFSGWVSRKPMAGSPTFAAIDGAIESLTRILSLELAERGLRVNAISPGAIETPLWNFIPAETRKQILDSFAASLPVQRVGTADDVAEAAIALLSNGFITGAVLDVDGGQR